MIKGLMKGVACTAAIAVSCGSAQALTIISYDITNTPTNASAGWRHVYSGIVTPTGGTSIIGTPIANYSGGSGTLNDGIIPIGFHDNHLFQTDLAPTVTFFLDGFYKLSKVELTSLFTHKSNAIPGNLASVTLTLGTSSYGMTFSRFGAVAGSGERVNERLTLTGAAANQVVSSFTLSNFQTTVGTKFPEYFAIGEAVATGTFVSPLSSAVPEPSTWALMLFGFGAVGYSMRSRKISYRRARAA